MPEAPMNLDQGIRLVDQKIENKATQLCLPLICDAHFVKHSGKCGFKLIKCLSGSPFLNLLYGQFSVVFACLDGAELPKVRGADFLSCFWRMCATKHAIRRARFAIPQNTEAAKDFQYNRSCAAITFSDLIRGQKLIAVQAYHFTPLTFGDFGGRSSNTVMGTKPPALRSYLGWGKQGWKLVSAVLANCCLVCHSASPINIPLSRSIPVTRAIVNVLGFLITHDGYGSQGNGQGRENAKREMIAFSPHCLKLNALPMFAYLESLL